MTIPMPNSNWYYEPEEVLHKPFCEDASTLYWFCKDCNKLYEKKDLVLNICKIHKRTINKINHGDCVCEWLSPYD